MDYRKINYDVKDQVATVTLNRPEAMNAIDQEMGGEIIDACRRIEEDGGVRVAIFTGAGEKAFSAGMDLKERNRSAGASPLERRRIKVRAGVSTPSQAIAAVTKPTIAAIRGYAVGGGLELSLACDFRVASEDAKLGLTEVRLGMIPGAGGTQRLARVVGRAKALEICLTGELVDGREARRLGLVNSTVAAEEVSSAAERLARALLKGAPVSQRFIKEAIHKGSELPLEDGLRLEADLSALIAGTEDCKEGPRAFVEKRAPVWKGK